jgi:type II secretory pathway component PulM
MFYFYTPDSLRVILLGGKILMFKQNKPDRVEWCLYLSMKRLKIPKWQSEASNRRTDNAMAKSKKEQTITLRKHHTDRATGTPLKQAVTERYEAFGLNFQTMSIHKL